MKGQWGLSVVLVVGVLLSLGSVVTIPPIFAEAAEPPPPTDISTDGVPVAAGTDSDWWATVQEALDASEYYVTWQEQTYLAGSVNKLITSNYVYGMTIDLGVTYKF